MPILPAEPDMYPDELWQMVDADSDPDRRWWCLHTKPRQEKTTARALRSRLVAHYLPQVLHEGRTPGGRKTRSVLPLFTGYLFLLGDDLHRVEALRTHNLVSVLEVTDQEGLARDLRQIHQMVTSGLPVLPEPTHPIGSKIRILSGPLTGLVGTVVRRSKRDQFVAVVRFLGRGATVDLEDWQVERIDE
jgi:transcription antitermination factor NusG